MKLYFKSKTGAVLSVGLPQEFADSTLTMTTEPEESEGCCACDVTGGCNGSQTTQISFDKLQDMYNLIATAIVKLDKNYPYEVREKLLLVQNEIRNLQYE